MRKSIKGGKASLGLSFFEENLPKTKKEVPQDSLQVPEGYKILDLLGEGGFGSVYKVNHVLSEDPFLQRVEAMKILRIKNTPKQITRMFLQELDALTKLEDITGILNVYAAGITPDGRLFYTTRFISGQSLDKVISDYFKKNRTTDMEHVHKIINYICQIADTLDEARKKGVIHLDIKPENIMIQRENALLIDLGLAKTLELLNTKLKEKVIAQEKNKKTREIAGTPKYMSPEQISGKDVDHKSDIFSLGQTLFECLTGKPQIRTNQPYQVATQLATRNRHIPFPPEAKLPKELESIYNKCTQKIQKHRYRTSGELAEDLRRWLREECPRAHKEGFSSKLVRYSKNNSAIMVLALFFSFVIIIATLGLYYADQKTKKALRLATIKAKQAAKEEKKRAEIEKRLRKREERIKKATQELNNIGDRINQGLMEQEDKKDLEAFIVKYKGIMDELYKAFYYLGHFKDFESKNNRYNDPIKSKKLRKESINYLIKSIKYANKKGLKFSHACFDLAEIFKKNGNTKQAILWYQKGSHKWPHKGKLPTTYEFVCTYQALKMQKYKYKLYKYVLYLQKLDRDNWRMLYCIARYWLAKAYSSNDKNKTITYYKNAQKYLLRCLKNILRQNGWLPLRALAQCELWLGGKNQKALTKLNLSLLANPNNKDAITLKLIALMWLQRYKEAYTFVSKYNLRPIQQNYRIIFYRAEICFKLKKYKKAYKDYLLVTKLAKPDGKYNHYRDAKEKIKQLRKLFKKLK